MTNNESQGPIQVMDLSLFAINDAMRQLVDRIDELKGLRGRAAIFDRVQVGTPSEGTDAVNLDSAAALSPYVTIQGAQTVTGAKTFTTPFRVEDATGHLIHSFGAIA